MVKLVKMQSFRHCWKHWAVPKATPLAYLDFLVKSPDIPLAMRLKWNVLSQIIFYCTNQKMPHFFRTKRHLVLEQQMQKLKWIIWPNHCGFCIIWSWRVKGTNNMKIWRFFCFSYLSLSSTCVTDFLTSHYENVFTFIKIILNMFS